MLQALLRALTRPPGWLLARTLDAAASRRMGRRGMLELALTSKLEPLPALRALERAVEHPATRGVVLHIRDFQWGWATLQEWREAIGRWRAAGNLVVTVLEATGNGGYYLASAADRVLIAPSGEIALLGVGTAMSFFGPALEKVGLRFEVEAAGAYKSFGEQFTRDSPSPENREAMEALIDGLHDELVAAIASSRGLTQDAVQALIDRAPLGADEALEAGLVDTLGYDDTLDELLQELLGDEGRRVSAAALERLDRWSRWFDGLFSRLPAVAVVHLQGGVVMGDQPQRGRPAISARDVPPVLDQLKNSPDVKAVVLVVESPGGSALASDIIWRSIELLKREKPVVASLGNVAASGGYYIAAACSEIIARPSTLTGSIGVVGGKLVVGKALERVGVNTHVISRGPNVGVYGIWEGFDEQQRARFRARLKSTYDLFLKRVSDGRRVPVSAIAQVAEGRVWTGSDARQGGLVDHLGGLEHALARARSLSGLRAAEPWQRVDLAIRPPGSRMTQLLRRLVTEDAAAPALRLPAADAPLSALEVFLSHPDQPLALFPADVAFGDRPASTAGFRALDLLLRWRQAAKL